MVLAVIATGVEKLTCCQPEAVSPLKVAVASSVAGARPEVADVRAGVAGALVEADAGDVAGDVGAELDAERRPRSRGRSPGYWAWRNCSRSWR